MRLLICLAMILIASYGLGLISGPERAKRIVKWEVDLLLSLGRYVLKLVFQLTADFFGYLAKQCEPKKKKKAP